MPNILVILIISYCVFKRTRKPAPVPEYSTTSTARGVKEEFEMGSI